MIWCGELMWIDWSKYKIPLKDWLKDNMSWFVTLKRMVLPTPFNWIPVYRMIHWVDPVILQVTSILSRLRISRMTVIAVSTCVAFPDCRMAFGLVRTCPAALGARGRRMRIYLGVVNLFNAW
jgi:hypothetical protein